MTDDVAAWKQRLGRPASRMVVGGFRPPSDPVASWLGRITLGEVGEVWPKWRGRLMWPLLQVVVRELPFVPAALDDVAAIRIFIDPDFYDGDCWQGEGWELRATSEIAQLTPLAEPDHGSRIRPFPGRWEMIDADYPTHDDLPANMPDAIRSAYCELGWSNRFGTKFGGWPSNIQSEISWAPWNGSTVEFEYVFQIDTEPKAHWSWGDNGAGYFGRGTGPHRDRWAMDHQCY